MFGSEKRAWMELCELAANEQDPQKLMALIAEIDQLLEQKHLHIAEAQGTATENPT
jgi:hypothetical protein